MSINIRSAAIGDEALLASLNRFVQDVHLAERPETFKPTHPEELAGWYRSMLEKPTTRAWIAEADRTAVAYILAVAYQAAESPFAQTRRWWEIDQIAVDPNRRRVGIARALVFTVVAAARTEGVRQIETASWSFNTSAHDVFRRLGFHPKITRFELHLVDDAIDHRES
jgi:GNAT superfamily N-acetyltransferase